MTDWQPIETAPRDGNRVLLYREGWREHTAVGWWSRTEKRWYTVPGTWPFNGATHWTLLPEPPK